MNAATMTPTALPKRADRDDDALNHITQCHDENVALCGADLSDVPWIEDDVDPVCVVCDDLDQWHCGCECGCCGKGGGGGA